MAAKQTRRRRAGGQQTGAGNVSPGTTVQHAPEAAGELAAWRCWTWRDRHRCPCLRLADCLLHGPLPIHEPQPCAGEFTPAGWQPHCQDGAA